MSQCLLPAQDIDARLNETGRRCLRTDVTQRRDALKTRRFRAWQKLRLSTAGRATASPDPASRCFDDRPTRPARLPRTRDPSRAPGALPLGIAG